MPVAPRASRASSVAPADVPERGADAKTPFWSAASDSVLWARVTKLDTLFTIGIKAPGARRGFWKGQRLVDAQTWRGAPQALVARPGVRIVAIDSVLPLIEAKISSFETFVAIRRLPFVDYIEPTLTGAEEIRHNDSGCDYPTSGLQGAADGYGDYVSLSYTKMYIDRAWQYASGAGQGVTVGLTDTGVDTRNPEMGSLFATGMSTGRTFRQQRQSNYTGLTYPECSHGTRMAGVIAAPRDGFGPVGVAYRANLFSSWTQNQVTEIDATNQRQGIRDAKDAGSKVITIAWNSEPLATFARAGVDDEINEGYYSRDIVFVAAAGTTFGGNNQNNVVWPAEKSEVIAASAANLDGTRQSASHYGPELDLVVYAPTASVAAPTLGATNLSKLEQSSSGAAIVSGIAAMVRSKYPTMDNVGVANRLKLTAGTACGPATAFGPIVNAESAVGGLCVQGGGIAGSDMVTWTNWSDNASRYVQFSVNASGGSGNIRIQWSNGTVGPTATYEFPRGNYTTTVSATVTDLGTGGVSPMALSRVVRAIDSCDDEPPTALYCY